LQKQRQKLEQATAEFATQCEEHNQATVELTRHRDELEQLRQQHQQDLERQREALEQQTSAIAAETSRLAEQTAELEARTTEVQAAQEQLGAAREELERRERQLSDQMSAATEQRAGQTEQLSRALAEARETAATSTAAASELRQTVEELQQSHERLRESTGVSEQRHGELQHKHELLQQQYQELRRSHQESTESKTQSAADWEAERAALIARAAEAEHQLSQIDPRQLEDSQRRFEMAISDVRDLKRRNAELEEQLIGLRAAGVGSAPQQLDHDVSPDWEATKRRMLEALEADNGEAADAINVEQRMTVESTIQITDQIVAVKDREILELRMHLSQQSSNIGAVAVGAAAIAESLDRDELIQQEREKLRVLQEEWRDKLRQAEIDISIERARIARQRAEVEEKVSAYDSARAQHTADDNASNPTNQPKQPTRGRWLARLGLKDDAG
jgi:chromosome segregation ATPase